MTAFKTWQDVIAAVDAGTNLDVEFKRPIEDQEGYLEAGMRARIVAHGGELEPGVLKVFVTLEPFKAHNRGLEKSVYYDAAGNPTLTATAAGYYPKDHRDHFYVDLTAELVELADVLPSSAVALFQEHQSSGTGASYVRWLEETVLATRAEHRSGLEAMQARTLQAAKTACAAEKVDAPATGHPTDLAYNNAIDHCLQAIDALAGAPEALC